MKNGFLALTLAAVAMTAAAAVPAQEKVARQFDAPRKFKRPPLIANMPEAAQSPTNAEVGDGDSFGRSVNFLGFAQTYGVSIQPDCTGWEPGTCAVSDGSEYVTIEHYGDEAVVRLPGRSARSLLCISAQPIGFAAFNNPTTTRQQASVVMMGRWRIESEVLADPTLINGNTGEPFGGMILGGPFLGDESFTIEPGANRIVQFPHSRACNGGSLRRSQLIEMGLTPVQAREVFRKPITIRFGTRLSTQWGLGSSSPGYRIYGD